MGASLHHSPQFVLATLLGYSLGFWSGTGACELRPGILLDLCVWRLLGVGERRRQTISGGRVNTAVVLHVLGIHLQQLYDHC
mgnify:CR=1 FL=1